MNDVIKTNGCRPRLKWLIVAVLIPPLLIVAVILIIMPKNPIADIKPAPPLGGEGFKPLFDGESLSKWKGDSRFWKVRNGTIVGDSRPDGFWLNPVYLVHDGQFKNFILRLRCKLHNNNSGVQFRSRVVEERMHGYQFDFTESNNFTGDLYEEDGRGFLGSRPNPDQVAKIVRQGDWNDLAVIANGPHLQLILNGHLVVDYHETDPHAFREGSFALQLHNGAPMEVEFKDIFVKELP